jgi:peptidoglycan/LPS O-acetylase OafA/YrhL
VTTTDGRPRSSGTSNLSVETSLYLDAVRFLAALIVFLGHFATYALSGGLFWQIAPFRHDAVIVFFVLSGFVIAHAVAKGEHDVKVYVANRAARIYSVTIPAIAITVALDSVALHFKQDYCAWGCSTGPAWLQVLTSATFTNQVWGLDLFPGSDGPYWSLGFEVSYYAMFALARFTRGHRRFILPLAMMAFVGPTITALFPLWLLGVIVYGISRRDIPKSAGWVLFLGSILVWGAIERWAIADNGWILNFPIAGVARDRIPADYVTGIAFATNIIGFQAIGPAFGNVLRRFQRSIRWLAARTFTLYLLHFPIMRFLSAFLPWGPQAPLTRVVTLVATLLAICFAASAFELRKQAWRRFFMRGMTIFGSPS